MKFVSSVCLLVGILMPVASLSAQSTTPAFLTASSTGMMGLAATQTAQISVANLSTATTTTVSPCEVQLEFWDATGKMVKSTTISNLAPGTAGQFQIKLADVTTSTSTLRTEVRGVVRTNPLPITSGSGTSTPIAYPFSCSVATMLEVFDNSTGVTQSLTSDLHPQAGIAVPLIRSTLPPVPQQ